MKRLIIFWLVMCVCSCPLVCAAQVNNAPMPNNSPMPNEPAAISTQYPPHFYGYVPPPPIRHTWPGGYRAIIHEMTNTLIEHMLGRY